MRNKLEVNFQTEDAEMERIWEKHIAPNFSEDRFAQKKCVEGLWNDETINDNELAVSLMKVGEIIQILENKNNPQKMLAQLLGGL